MSLVTPIEVAAYLNLTHDLDNGRLQTLIDGAEDECLQFLDRDSLPRKGVTFAGEQDSNDADPTSDSDDLAPTVRMAIYLLVQGMYEGKDAPEMAAVRRLAEVKLMPYRNRLGI